MNYFSELDDLTPREKQAAISYDQNARCYLIRGKRVSLDRITSIASSQFPPFDKERISKIVAAREGKTQEAVLAEWTQAADDGSEVHEMVENHIKHGTRPDRKHRLADFFYLGYLKFREDHPHLEQLESEVRVYWIAGRVCGTVDLIAYNTLLGEYEVYDWKVIKELKKVYPETERGYPPFDHVYDTNYYHYSVQLSVYTTVLSMCYRDLYGIVTRAHLVRLTRTGYEKVPIEDLRGCVMDVFSTRVVSPHRGMFSRIRSMFRDSSWVIVAPNKFYAQRGSDWKVLEWDYTQKGFVVHSASGTKGKSLEELLQINEV